MDCKSSFIVFFLFIWGQMRKVKVVSVLVWEARLGPPARAALLSSPGKLSQALLQLKT